MEKKHKIVIISILIIAIIGGLVFYLYNLQQEKEMQALILGEKNFYDGISIADINMSGKSKEEAHNSLQSYAENILNKDFHINIDNEDIKTNLKELGLKINYEEVLDDAYIIGRTGSEAARLNTINEIKNNPINLELKTELDSKALNDYITKLDKNYLSEPVEPRIEYTEDSFNIIEGKNGVEININKLVEDIKTAIKTGKDSVVAETIVKEPKTSNDMLNRINGVIGEFSTFLGNGTKARNDNVKLSCKLISDRILMPGDVISFNDEMGEITVENGYKMASTIVNGKYVDSLGGGLCQTSTTLYNALVRADVEILERHSHSIAAPYVAVGADAAVWKGSKDLKFKNNWDFPILIKSWVDDKKIYFKIYGDTNVKNYDIELKSTITETIPAGKSETENPEIASGEEKIVRKGRNGQRANSVKIYTKDGQNFKTVDYFKSYYPMQNEIVEKGTGAPDSEDNLNEQSEGTPETIDLFN